MWTIDNHTDWSGLFCEKEYKLLLNENKAFTLTDEVLRNISKVDTGAWKIVEVDNPNFIGIGLAYEDKEGLYYLDVINSATNTYFATYVTQDKGHVNTYKKYYRGFGPTTLPTVAFVRGKRVSKC